MRDASTIEQLDDSRRLQLLVDSVVDYAIYLLDINGRVLTWNSRRKAKGLSAK